jgi:hypothetical protein
MLKAWQKGTIVPTTGIDESNDAILQTPGSASDILNMVMEKGGRFVKRNGFTEIASYALVDTPGYSVRNYNPKSLFSTGKELCLVDGHNVYAYSDDRTDWVKRGLAPIGTGELSRINTHTGDCRSASVAHSANYTVEAYTTTTKDMDGVGSLSYLYVTIKDSDGIVIQRNVQIATGNSAGTWVHSCKVIYQTTGKFVIAYHVGCNHSTGTAISGTINIYTWTESAPQTAPALLVTVSDAQATYDSHCQYDIIPVSATQFAIGYVDHSANDAYLQVINATSGATYAGPIAVSTRTTYNCVAVGWDPIEEQIFFARAGETAGTNYLDWSAHTLDGSLTTEYTNNAFLTEITAFGAQCIGVSNVATCGGTTIIAIGWTNFRSSAASMETRIRTAIPSTGSLVGSEVQGMNGCSMLTQPFIVNDHCYCGLLGQSRDVLGGCAYIVDMGFQDTVVINAAMVGMWDMSAVPQVFEVAQIDSHGSNVGAPTHPSILNITLANPEIHFASPSIRDPFITADTTKSDEFLLDWNHVTITTSAKVKGYKMAEGTAIIPGTMTAWYDGNDTFELGVCSTMDYSINSGVGSPGLPAGTYSYKGYWQVKDAAGFIHRGPVGAARSITLGSTLDVDAVAVTFAATARNRTGPQQHAILFRSSVSDAVYRRVSRPSTVCTNSWELDITKNLWSDDDLADTGAPIYVEGGADLDAVAPAGCKGAAIVKDRVWLSGFYRKDRLQYSDPITPATANSDQYAPEFNEAFSIMSPDGSEFTGIVDFVDRVIIFTENKVYLIAGEPGDLAGQGSTLSGLQCIADKIGCTNRDSIVKYPDGIFFQSEAGLCHLNRKFEVEFVEIVDTTISDSGFSIVGSACHDADRMVVFALKKPDDSDGLLLCYDYGSKLFVKWRVVDSLGSDIKPIDVTFHNGKLYILDIEGDIYYSNDTWVDESTFVQSWTTGWITPTGNKNSLFKIRYVSPLMRRQSTDGTAVTVTVYYDYDDASYNQYVLPWSELSTYGSSLIVDPRLHVSRNCRAFKVKISADSSVDGTNGRGIEFMAIDYEWSPKVPTTKPTAVKRN